MQHKDILPPPRDRSLTRAERRRQESGKGDVPGMLGCKFCYSTKGIYIKAANWFNCATVGCRGNSDARKEMKLGGTE